MPVNIRIDIYARVDDALLLLLWFSCDYFVKLHNLRLHAVTTVPLMYYPVQDTGEAKSGRRSSFKTSGNQCTGDAKLFTSVRKERKFIIVTDVRSV